ncbi:MAG: hypothetical protein ACTH4Y_08240 [Microbacterium gubbeenense]|uniref:hypothetical protein n=1 Tax=Microbacterium gubbeenense TaxID=159896 RepID=UPI003F9AE110
MSDYEYDPKLPYVVEDALRGGLIARFASPRYADDYAGERASARVIDTTPKPRVPEDAKYIAWLDPYENRYFAYRADDGWDDGVGSLYDSLEDLPGVTPDTVFTVLEERKSS